MNNLSTTAIVTWLNNHRAAIAAGMNVGQLDRNKAQQFRLELAKRDATETYIGMESPRSARPGQLPF
jgi:hypothetical protein